VVKKSAFTLIELIFSIVIISIAVISMPTITQVSSKGIENSLVQEAIFTASTELSQAQSYYWDENSVESANTLARVINLNNNDCNSVTKLRPGHINQPKHRRCLNNNTTPLLNAAGGTINDLNDLSHNQASIFDLAFSADADGYKQDYNSTFIITYPQAGVKKITSTIVSNNNIISSLSAYSCNIGEIDYHKKTY